MSAKISHAREAKLALKIARKYCAIIKDNLNELTMRVNYAENTGDSCDHILNTVNIYCDKLKALAENKEGL